MAQKIKTQEIELTDYKGNKEVIISMQHLSLCNTRMENSKWVHQVYQNCFANRLDLSLPFKFIILKPQTMNRLLKSIAYKEEYRYMLISNKYSRLTFAEIKKDGRDELYISRYGGFTSHFYSNAEVIGELKEGTLVLLVTNKVTSSINSQTTKSSHKFQIGQLRVKNTSSLKEFYMGGYYRGTIQFENGDTIPSFSTDGDNLFEVGAIRHNNREHAIDKSGYYIRYFRNKLEEHFKLYRNQKTLKEANNIRMQTLINLQHRKQRLTELMLDATSMGTSELLLIQDMFSYIISMSEQVEELTSSVREQMATGIRYYTSTFNAEAKHFDTVYKRRIELSCST